MDMYTSGWYERERRKHLERKRREAEELADGTYDQNCPAESSTETPELKERSSRILLKMKFVAGADLLVKRVEQETGMGPVNLN
jgi:hypothetical protein